jgi:hypothetical protein
VDPNKLPEPDEETVDRKQWRDGGTWTSCRF